MNKTLKSAIALGLLASFFFSFTFLLNRQMHLAGGSWQWSASLRYFFMLPLLWLLLSVKKQTRIVFTELKKHPLSWLVFSTIGFGMFYAPLCYASAFHAAWLTAGTWQITIVAGALMSPLFYTSSQHLGTFHKTRNKVPKQALLMSCVILAGIFLVQFEEASQISVSDLIAGIIPVLIAAFAYPFGNRKMIELCEGRLSTIQRVFGMTLCSIPFWILLSIYGTVENGLPGTIQLIQSLLVALFSGVIATILFFKATDLVRHSSSQLAMIEATQSGEVLFTLLGGIFFFQDSVPGLLSFFGILLIIAGMTLNCLLDQ